MGLKFRGKTSTGAPVDAIAPLLGAIKERELEINLTDGRIYTSSDGSDIIPLGYTPKMYEVADLAARDALVDVVPGHYCTYEDAAMNIVTDVWYNGAWLLVEKTP